MNVCDLFFFSSRRRHTRLQGDWSSDVCSSDLAVFRLPPGAGSGGRPASRFPLPHGARESSRDPPPPFRRDRKSTRLNSSHLVISYAVFCLKKKTTATLLPEQTAALGGDRHHYP